MAKSAKVTRTGEREPGWRRRKDQREPEILAAARAILAEQGLAGASIAAIGARAGVSEATVYNYFPNRRDLVFRVIADWMGPALDEMERMTRQIEGARSRLRLIAFRHITDMAENPGLHQLIYRELHWEDYYGSAVHKLNQRYARLIEWIIAEGRRLGEVRPDVDSLIARDMFFGAIQHVGWRTVLNGRPLGVDAVSRAIADQTFAAIESRSVTPLEEIVDRLNQVVKALETRA